MHLRSSEALGAKPQERGVTKAPPAKQAGERRGWWDF